MGHTVQSGTGTVTVLSEEPSKNHGMRKPVVRLNSTDVELQNCSHRCAYKGMRRVHCQHSKCRCHDISSTSVHRATTCQIQ
jgi:hypothetical protein